MGSCLVKAWDFRRDVLRGPRRVRAVKIVLLSVRVHIDHRDVLALHLFSEQENPPACFVPVAVMFLNSTFETVKALPLFPVVGGVGAASCPSSEYVIVRMDD
jgi:hypothetical protein